MSDTSEDEDLSRFKEAVDSSFSKMIDESRGKTTTASTKETKLRSERYLDEPSHYNDFRVPDELQKQISKKISTIIQKNIEFIDVKQKFKKHKIKGGVKLFHDSEEFLSCEEFKDDYTEIHNKESKITKQNAKKRRINQAVDEPNENDKLNSVVVSGDYVLSKDEVKCWKSRRKEKVFKYKSSGKDKLLTAVD